mgnify:CR=1 FL=1|tara:strand:+ start:14305 stop:15999 length:1695 start_codon:yes stop_codon:yes gene_type:complete
MPITTTLTDGQNFTIPINVSELQLRMWGGGGSGENVDASFTRISGTDGGDTELLGIKATGGNAGSVPGGGAGGSGLSIFNWSNYGVSVSTYNGTSGSLPSLGYGPTINGTRAGDGGTGNPGTYTYTSSVQHIFNNTTNQHIFRSFSSDIQVYYAGSGAADGVSCSNSPSLKHYVIYFNNAFTSANYSISITNVTQQAAGGGTGAPPYYNSGIAYKTSSGFRAWFCQGGGFNGYVRGFSITATGQKAGAQGQGGGGGGGALANFTRQNLIDSIIYAPGTTHVVNVGSRGTGGYSPGSFGSVKIYMLIRPEITLTATSVELIKGSSTTLSWSTSGDADSFVWLSGNINNTLLTSNITLTPEITTYYSAQASGLGGSSEIAFLTVYVFYVATASIEAPSEINYGDTLNVSFETQYADVAITIIPTYYYVDGTNTAGDPISIDPAITAESGRPDSDTVVNSVLTQVPVAWNNIGPESISVLITAAGRGGVASDNVVIPVNIDITPENLGIPETDDAFKDQDPVVTPDTDILTELLLVDGIDIPVTIKSNRQIKVDINQSGIWQNVEEI